MFIQQCLKTIGPAYADDKWLDIACADTIATQRKINNIPFNLTEDKATADELVTLLGQLSDEIQRCVVDNSIIKITVAAWSEYMREYRVKARDIDGYKVAYWYGEGIIQTLVRNRCRIEIIAAARILRLHVMDSVLFWNIGRSLTNDIFNKLCITCCRDKENLNLGKYGVYLVFKSLSLQHGPATGVHTGATA